MRSHYKKLEPYIREVNIRNNDLLDTRLLGVSIQKILIPSIANIIGTDMTTYKIIKKEQFAYGPVTSRNGDKISVALCEYDEGMVSQAYVVFEIACREELDPEYLMMWFSRPEFDRYARFKSHGSAREIFDWNEMCNIELPVPSIETQRQIVKEYNTIKNRLKHNKKLNQKLEETAQVVYKQWFVDFDFPDNNGKPYRSNGGLMVWSEELNQEIPKGWMEGCLGDLIELQRGFDLPTQDRLPGVHPIYASTGTLENHRTFKVKGPGIVTGRSGSLGEVFYIEEDFWPLNTTLWVKTYKNSTPIFIYYVLKSINISDYNSGSAVPTLNRNHLHLHRLIVPPINIIQAFEMVSTKIKEQTRRKIKENTLLENITEILFTKMSKLEILETA
ncbi:restriction endonuclease subunit S [Mucilaginibacter endophyticus]|uniref:restriction endonuclease subunit S n=1 Tax=Mucilaginibacter endophyticus TaxID=2675003 RepID=UPI000E0D981C|nr:restriction endonuclease subunit S [Mucilaginibacter endophyticus]